jgi:hypothetical protein
MDLTDSDDLDWRDRGRVEAASTDGDDVRLAGDHAEEDLPDDVDDVLADLLADHDVGRYPEGAVLAWFQPTDLAAANVRDPERVRSDPYP